MRHSGHVFRRGAARIAPLLLLLPVVLAAAGVAAPAPVRAAEAAEVTGLRLGRHAGFLRLVFDLTARPDYEARATGPRTFEVRLPEAALPPEGHAALAGDPLAPDLIVRPAPGDGPLRFRVTSRFDAFIRRAFFLDPPTNPPKGGAGAWRLVLDIVPRPGRRTPAEGGGRVVAALPPLHGLVPGVSDDGVPGEGGPVPRPAPLAEAPSGAAPDIAVSSGPAQTEVSWARASRILRELQDHQAPEAAQTPPQLVLAPKYRRPAVPLR